MAEADPNDERFNAAQASRSRQTRTTRSKLLSGIAGIVLLVGVAYGGWYLLDGRYHVETDDAYVGADTAQVTPMISGQVLAVLKTDTEMVSPGDVLVRLDDRDMRIALAQAEAELAKVQRQFGQTSSTSAALAAQMRARGADILSARAQRVAAMAAFDKAQIDFDRRQKLAPNGAVSGDELTSATNALASARASLEQSRANVAVANAARGSALGNLEANDALIRGTTIASSPDVLAAAARVAQARLDLSRTVVRAPIGGIVTSRSVQVGQRIASGSTVMRIVPINHLYVDANYKEGQLQRVKPGQAVTLTSDLYGASVRYHGRVNGFSGGTGSSFALIPAQNATGNWIKVVQRLPVRVTLDPRELEKHPLRIGLSMTADIDTAAR